MPMTYVLCPVTGAADDRVALDLSLKLAATTDGHVRALFVRPSVASALPFLGEGMTGAILENLVEVARKAGEEALRAAKASVADAKARPESISLSETEGLFEDEVEAASRLADVTVFRIGDSDDAAPSRAAVEAVLLRARRPVLLAPAKPVKSVGTKIAILWDGGATAAHAVMAALPLLRKAQAIEIIHMKTDEHKSASLNELQQSLSLRGLTSSVRLIERQGRGDGERLAGAAQAADADLVVMGGYGHSRLREMMLGGVTRYMLAQTPLPVFLAH